jgi:8-oxo-dGTP diphosphatase
MKEIITATAAVIRRADKILLTRRKADEFLGGYWEFPGGKVEPGETVAACLRRELAEELGVETKIGPLLAESEYTYDHGRIRLLAFETEILSGEIKLTVHDQASWVKVDELTNYTLSPADIPIADTLIRRRFKNAKRKGNFK